MNGPAGARPERGRDAALWGLGAVLPLSLAASNVLWAAAALFSLPSLFRRSWRWRPTGLELPWLAGVVWSLLSVMWSSAPGESARSLRPEILAVVFLLAVSSGGDRRRWVAWGAAAAVAGFLGIVQWGLGGDRADPRLAAEWPAWAVRAFSGREGRAMGLFSNPITYAEVLALVGFTALGGAMRTGRARWALALVGAGVLFSQTRGVWLATFVALALWAAVSRERKIWVALGVCVLAVSAAVAVNPALRRRAQSIGDRTVNTSNRIRLGLWDRSVALMREHPLRGIGPGRVRIPAEDLRWGGSVPGKIWTETHNMYLQVGLEKGGIGLGLFLWFLAAAGRALWRAQARDPALAGVFWGFVALLFAGLTESWFNDSEVVMNLYFALGTALRAADQKI